MTRADTDAYLEGVPEPARSTLAALCELVRASDDRLREEIKWNAPSFALTDHLATTGVHRDGTVRLVLHTGATTRADPRPIVVDDPRGLFERKGPDRIVAMLPAADAVADHAEDLRRILREWIAQAETAQAG